jgi:ubiquinone biosynthesis accessory factor UbiJ
MMLGIPSAASINHLLRGAPWALEKLADHAGKTVALKFGPIPLRFAVEPSGELSVAGSEREADVVIDVSPSLLMRTVTQGRAALNDAAISGDTGLAQALAYIAQHLQWDYEEDLSKFVGDIAAHRIGSTARGVGTWAKESADSVLKMSKDFWTEERPTLAKAQQVAEFVASVDELRDAIARLEKRIELLEQNARRG